MAPAPGVLGTGLATEGGRAGLGYGFDDVGLDRIVSIFIPENAASGRVMTKLEMAPFLATTDPTFGSPLEVREITAAAWRAQAPWSARMAQRPAG